MRDNAAGWNASSAASKVGAALTNNTSSNCIEVCFAGWQYSSSKSPFPSLMPYQFIINILLAQFGD
ncbi:hypothetical protein KCP69_10280 [Salmonella enterica subsp. enterica]|nr:hypothetical protein KCP69_10280 [Salmonella enterica subsp. enterica]